ncbi:hypothetical protein DV702_16605 [Sporosarcina sp. PTS2304]|uniref:YcdB/YcdC domain-containing protein n=1 Tax=Sporosarcina sp. PTS2304 TaxID=2283194 RepID=UPI000E0DC556|nr:YcdB/YcdC domain-containing protein [Sporosarcina sp. PTS2304]AXI01199.1 hypothetical protein DV702_16605 [Sporosarcina sp. PTS2304]
METIQQQLEQYLKQKLHFTPAEHNFYEDGEAFYIYKNSEQEPFATCDIDRAGKLRSLDYVEPENFGNGALKPTNMPAVAEKFIREFHPDGLDRYKLQSVIDLDDMCLVSYGIQDEQYGLDVPGIGFSLTITTAGEVVQFQFDGSEPDIRYPAHIMSSEEAKRAYTACTDFELEIRRTDTELFRNGDNSYRLVWSLTEAAIDIPADGDEPGDVADYREYEALPDHPTDTDAFFRLIGISEQHTKSEIQTDEGLRIVKWQKPSMADGELDFSEAYALGMITVHYDSANRPVFVFNGEACNEEEPLNNETLQNRALDYVFCLFPDAKERFTLEVLAEDEWEQYEEDVEMEADEEELEDVEEDLIEDWEEEADAEEVKDFYFRPHLNGVPIGDNQLSVSIGLFSGRVISATMESVEDLPPADTPTVPVLSKQHAAEILAEQLEMVLSLMMEFDEEGTTYYRLTYFPSFPATNGHVRMVDAVDGTAYFMDVGGSVFY